MTHNLRQGLQELSSIKNYAFRTALFAALIFYIGAGSSFVFAQPSESSPPENKTLVGDTNKVPAGLDGVGVQEHLGEIVNYNDFTFIDSQTNQEAKLSQILDPKKPTILNLVYFECPMLCTLVLNGVIDGLRGVDWSIGNEFNMVTISIDPNDTAELALAKKKNYIVHYLKSADGQGVNSKRPVDVIEKNWHFLTAKESEVKRFANTVGFLYKYDGKDEQYAHSAVTFVLTPEGKLSRYLYGVQYKPRDLRFALIEASQGKVGNVIDRLLMFCYHYDPATRGYAIHAIRTMQLGGLATLVILGGYLGFFWTRQRRKNT